MIGSDDAGTFFGDIFQAVKFYLEEVKTDPSRKWSHNKKNESHKKTCKAMQKICEVQLNNAPLSKRKSSRGLQIRDTLRKPLLEDLGWLCYIEN